MVNRSIIKKRMLAGVIIALLAGTIALTIALLLPKNAAGSRAQAQSDRLNAYRYDLVFRPDDNTLAVTMTLDYTNHTGAALHELVLRTWAGAYANEDTSPAAIDELYDACYPQGFSAGDIQLAGVWWNDALVTAQFDDQARTVLRVPIGTLEDGGQGQLLLRCELTIPSCAHRFGIDGTVWRFGNALPILAVWQNGAWRTDEYYAIGEPFVSECANYSVVLITPAGFSCAAGASTHMEMLEDGRIRYTMQASAMRDFSFALSQQWQQAQKKTNGVVVTAYAASKEEAERAAGYAADALHIYASLYGDYAYAQLTVCALDYALEAASYPGIIFVDAACLVQQQDDALALLLAHETAHQWFYALVGSDQVNDAWQDEALCEYALLRYTQKKYGSAAYDNLRILRVDAPMREKIGQIVTAGAPLSYFGSWQVYDTVVRGRGAALLLALDALTGGMDDILHAYCEQFAFMLVSREDFEHFVCQYSGMDIAPLMQDYLDTYGY